MLIRPLTQFHAAEMAEIEKQCFSLPWSYEAVKTELLNPIARYIGAFVGGRLIGYVGIQCVLDEGYITNVATVPDMRRQGVADALMTDILAFAEEKGLCFATLEVRESNISAQRLYKKHGFLQAGRRRGYYEQPREDAIIMTKDFFPPQMEEESG